MKELSAGDPLLLSYVMGCMSLNLGQASCLLTSIKRYLDGDVSEREFDMVCKEWGDIRDDAVREIRRNYARLLKAT